ncbi:MAG: glycyl-radical enzyme activating protein [Acidobacteria bacterium]|nr:glycyl-radical enzyme activating protein [Acidobacteriota bacterium]
MNPQEPTGIIFDIKHYAIHDGPGIRTTVFLKGCPLACRWCHNPEGIAPEPQLLFRAEACLPDCRRCVAACPNQAITADGRSIRVDTTRCRACGRCAEACPTEALRLVGRRMSVTDVLREIEKDRVFYDESGGGATFSGGEPLAQPAFLTALLDECRRRGIHSVVDTSGYAPSAVVRKIADRTDLFLYDLKALDPDIHRQTTGQDNRLILENLRLLAREGARVMLRVPYIPGVNDDEESLRHLSALLKELRTIREIALLPFHRGADHKYRQLQQDGEPWSGDIPDPQDLVRAKAVLESEGVTVRIGG